MTATGIATKVGNVQIEPSELASVVALPPVAGATGSTTAVANTVSSTTTPPASERAAKVSAPLLERSTSSVPFVLSATVTPATTATSAATVSDCARIDAVTVVSLLWSTLKTGKWAPGSAR